VKLNLKEVEGLYELNGVKGFACSVNADSLLSKFAIKKVGISKGCSLENLGINVILSLIIALT